EPASRIGVGRVVRGDDRVDARVGPQRRDRGFDRRAERRVLRAERVAGEDERERRPADARKLLLDQLRRAAGFSGLDETAALELPALRGDECGSDEERYGNGEYGPAMAVDKAAPGGEQPSVFSPSMCAASSVRGIGSLRVTRPVDCIDAVHARDRKLWITAIDFGIEQAYYREP